ncbi:hypothetical protein F383_38662 [Gossypium arboreum]|uniref:Uncharacterized protein n=1 Tax=Gossypium arboreum TaxID=29729 RepID=A0A0B0MLQ2_GOSAR|nr:hypothetical protein F383_38662 [Gossypium arboreum]
MYTHCSLNLTFIILTASPLTFILHLFLVVKQFIYKYLYFIPFNNLNIRKSVT